MRVIATLGAVGLLLVMTVPAMGAQKTGCPAADGWELVTVEESAATIWPDLLDPSAFPGGQTELAAALAGYDRNGDDWLCVKVQPQDNNPNAHWYKVGLEILGEPTTYYIPSDNNRGATD